MNKHLQIGAALLLAVPVFAATPSDSALDKKAREIHQRVLTLDSHVDVLLPSTPERYWAPGHSSRADVDKLQKGSIDALYKSGVRVFGFVHAGNNDFADSSRPSESDVPPQQHQGLSPLGRQAVAKLNNLGIIIDVSQLTTDGVLQTLQLSRAPVIASHSAARALVDHPRNL